MKKRISLSKKEMILISLDSVLQKKEKCSIADLIKESFTLFPKHFSLKEYPEFPDSLKLDRELRELNSEGIINGRPRTHYTFTKSGRHHVDNLNKLDSDKLGARVKGVIRSPAFQTFEKIKSGSDYNKFIKQKKLFSPNDMNFRATIGFTLETPIKKIVSEIKYLLDHASKSNNSTLVGYFKRYLLFYNNE